MYRPIMRAIYARPVCADHSSRDSAFPPYERDLPSRYATERGVCLRLYVRSIIKRVINWAVTRWQPSSRCALAPDGFSALPPPTAADGDAGASQNHSRQHSRWSLPVTLELGID